MALGAEVRRPVMRLSALRTMKGMNGGGPDMSDRDSCAACPGVPRERGYDQAVAARGIRRTGQLCRYREVPHPVRSGAAVWGRPWWGRSGVWTVSTLWVSDWAVPVPDWAGFRMFRRESSVCKGWNPVRVPPRARVFPVQGPFRVFSCAHCAHARL